MNITKKDVANQFGLPVAAIEQIGSKQLFIVDAANFEDCFDSGTKKYYNVRLLVSYRTIVGICKFGEWQITSEKFSPTTSKQLTQFLNSYNGVRVSVEDFDDLLRVVGK